MVTDYKKAEKELRALSSTTRAKTNASFFKSTEGKAGAGDLFLGVRTPDVRLCARRYLHLDCDGVAALLQSPYNEMRMLGLLIWVMQYDKADSARRQEIYRRYLACCDRVNNWNLVDASAHLVIGRHLENKSRAPLYRLAASKNIWERRVAVVATWWFIRAGETAETFALCTRLLDDGEDLMHKACGWMLREAGKKDMPALEAFIRTHYPRMPRTMLRYAIEKFPEARRKKYLKGVF